MTPNRKAIALIVIVIAIAWSDILLLGRGFYRNDVISYHYPMKSAVRQIVARGAMPYWNPYISSGQPLAANPAYEVWYPPQWLVFLPSFHYGLQLHIVLHFFLAAIGMYLLLRSLDLSIAASIFGALAFAFSGPYLSLTTRLPLLFSLSWMPLALYFVRGGQTILSVLALAMQLLIGEPTIVLQTWILIGAYVLWRRSFRNDIPRIALIGVLAALVAAIQLIPAIDFARDTVRSRGMLFVYVSNWSMPLVRPIEMLFPSLFAHMKNDAGATLISTMYPYRTEPFLDEIYIGMFVTILVIAGLFAARKGRGLVIALFAISFIAAAGDHTPLLKLLYNLHLAKSLRYPEKFIIAGAFVLIVWAAMMFDRLRDDARLARISMVLATIALIVMAFAAISGDTRYWLTNIARAVVVIALIGPLRTRMPRVAWQTTIIALTAIDLYASMQTTTPRMPRSFFDPPQIVATMPKANDARYFHEAGWDIWDQKPGVMDRMVGSIPDVYWGNFWRGLFPNLTELYGFQLALEDDIDQTSLTNTDDLRELLKSVRRAGDLAGEAALLKQSNVRWRIRFAPSDVVMIDPTTDAYPRFAFADAIVPATSAGEVRVNLDKALGASKVAYANESFAPSPGVVSSIEQRDNAIRLTTQNAGRGLLLISITAHKYWRATIDGRNAPLIPANIAYQALDVPAGTHTIEMRYRNPLIMIGAIVTALTLIALLGVRWR